MADSFLESLFSGGVGATSGSADINAFNKTIGANDYWKLAANPILGAKFNTSTWSPGQTLGVGVGQAFLGSILSAIGQKSEEDQLAKVTSILPQLYKNPESIGDIEGVDSGALNALKANAIQKNATREAELEDAKSRLFAGIGGQMGEDGSLHEIPGWSDLMTNKLGIAAEFKHKEAKGSAINQRTVKDLAGTAAAISAIQDAEDKIQNIGGDGILGSVLTGIEKHIPGTDAYNYQKSLPFLADPLTVGLSGSSRQGILAKTLESLDLGVGQSMKSRLDVIGSAKKAMIDKGLTQLEVLKQAGYPAEDLDQYKSTLEEALSGKGTVKDYSSHQDAPSMDVKAFAAQAKAQGLSKEEARQKWKELGN